MENIFNLSNEIYRNLNNNFRNIIPVDSQANTFVFNDIYGNYVVQL